MDRLKIGRQRIYDAMCLFFTLAQELASLTGDIKSETPGSQSWMSPFIHFIYSLNESQSIHTSTYHLAVVLKNATKKKKIKNNSFLTYFNMTHTIYILKGKIQDKDTVSAVRTVKQQQYHWTLL